MKLLLLTSILATLIPPIVAEIEIEIAQPASAATGTSASASSIATASSSYLEATTTSEVLDATITEAPHFDGDVSGWIQEKWHLTTFWSCNTFDQTYVDCGWHEPVLPGGTEIAAAPRAMDARHAAIIAGVAVGVNAFLQ